MGLVYKVTNKINDKIYIGVTINKFSSRKTEHLRSARNLDNTNSFSIFHMALNKYGFDNFEWEILEYCDNDVLSDREIYYIDLYNSYATKKGYNLTKGGISNFGTRGEYYWLNRMPEDDRKEWLKNYRFGVNNGMYNNGEIVSGEKHFSKRLSPEERTNWLDKVSGEKNYQKKLSKEELKDKCWINRLSDNDRKEWIAKNLKGKNNPFYNNTKKYVITFPSGEEYIIKVMEFCQEYKDVKLHSAALYSMVRGLYNQYKGYKCRLASEEDIKNIKEWQSTTL